MINLGFFLRFVVNRAPGKQPDSVHSKPGVALTGRNRTGPPCSVGRPPAHAPGRPARRQRYRRRQTTTDTSQQNNTGPLGGPVTMYHVYCSVRAVTVSVLKYLEMFVLFPTGSLLQLLLK